MKTFFISILCIFCTLVYVIFVHEHVASQILYKVQNPEISKAQYQKINNQCMQYSSEFRRFVGSYFADDEIITQSEYEEIQKFYNRVKRADSMMLYLKQKAYDEDDGK